MKLFYVVLVILLFYNLGLTLYVFKINRRLKEFNQILLEIEKGQSKQKFLLKKNNRIDQVGFRVNSILYKYEKRIEESNIKLEANKQLMTSLSHDVRTPMTTLRSIRFPSFSGSPDNPVRSAPQRLYRSPLFCSRGALRSLSGSVPQQRS